MILRMKVPPEVRALVTDERRLAWAVSTTGLPLVATPQALYAGQLRLPWTQVEKAQWQPPVLTVLEVSEVEGTGLRHTWELDRNSRLPEVVRAQVTSSIGWSDRRRLSTTGAVRLVGRRVPGKDALLWQVVYLEGADPADEQNRAQVEEFVEDLRGTLG